MGADAWYQTGPYLPDFEQALHAVHVELMRQHDLDADGRTPQDLWQDEEWCEYVATGGTGSPLDLCRVVPQDNPAGNEFAAVRPMSPEEFSSLLRVRSPTYGDFVDGYVEGRIDNYTGRGCARCAVVYKDGAPHEIVYWGCTAD